MIGNISQRLEVSPMARKVQVNLVDDIDGTDAAETLRFGLDGTNYEIDLNEKHAAKLRGALEKYVASGRKLGRGHPVVVRRGRAGGTPARSDRAQNQAVREWAKRKGIEVSERGRIPASVLAQYQAEAGR
jgi:hypothetical protein